MLFCQGKKKIDFQKDNLICRTHFAIDCFMEIVDIAMSKRRVARYFIMTYQKQRKYIAMIFFIAS